VPWVGYKLAAKVSHIAPERTSPLPAEDLVTPPMQTSTLRRQGAGESSPVGFPVQFGVMGPNPQKLVALVA
jgi:hypothetical protein